VAYHRAMPTGVWLDVTPTAPIDPHGRYELPTELARLIAEVGQSWQGALSRSGNGPWRFNLRVTGPDRFDLGRRLEEDIRRLGYAVDLSVAR